MIVSLRPLTINDNNKHCKVISKDNIYTNFFILVQVAITLALMGVAVLMLLQDLAAAVESPGDQPGA